MCEADVLFHVPALVRYFTDTPKFVKFSPRFSQKKTHSSS